MTECCPDLEILVDYHAGHVNIFNKFELFNLCF